MVISPIDPRTQLVNQIVGARRRQGLVGHGAQGALSSMVNPVRFAHLPMIHQLMGGGGHPFAGANLISALAPLLSGPNQGVQHGVSPFTPVGGGYDPGSPVAAPQPIDNGIQNIGPQPSLFIPHNTDTFQPISNVGLGGGAVANLVSGGFSITPPNATTLSILHGLLSGGATPVARAV